MDDNFINVLVLVNHLQAEHTKSTDSVFTQFVKYMISQKSELISILNGSIKLILSGSVKCLWSSIIHIKSVFKQLVNLVI